MALVQDLLRRTADSLPDHPALRAGDQVTTFGAWDRASDGVAAALIEAGLERGDRCLIVLDNCPELAVGAFGVLKAGGTMVIVGATTGGTRLGEIIADCEPAFAIATPAARNVLNGDGVRRVMWVGGPGDAGGWAFEEAASGAGRAGDSRADDCAAIIYTSGTLGEPKGVMLSHRGLVHSIGVITGYLGNTPDDVVLCVLPLSFSYGLCQLLGAASAGYTLLLERSFAYPADVLKRAAAARVTGLPGAPTAFSRLLGMDPLPALPSLRYATNAAAAMAPSHIRRFREAYPGVAFYSMYGQTECTRIAYLDPGLVDEHPGSVGRVMAGSSGFIVDESGREVPRGRAGELVVQGPNLMMGYWRKPEATARAIRMWNGAPTLFTGDEFRMNGEGLLEFIGRRDDIFKCRGEKVAPRAVEAVICELGDVAEVAVVGVADAADGLAVKAIVVPREGSTLTEGAVRRHCLGRLEAHMVPRFVEFRADLPRTESGKVRRAALRGNV